MSRPEAAARGARDAAFGAHAWPRRRLAASAREALQHAVVLLLLLVLSFALLAVGLHGFSHRWIGASYGAFTDDHNQISWFMAWVAYAITHVQDPLFTTTIHGPRGANLMWDNLPFLPALLLSPVTLLKGPTAAYNTLALLGPVSSGYAAWWAFRRITRHSGASALGAILYAFSPYMSSQEVAHPALTWMAVPPLLLVLGYELLVVQQHSARRLGVLLGILAAAQILTFEETLAGAAVVGLLGLVVVAVMRPALVTGQAAYVLRAAPWALGVFLLIAGGPLLFQFLGPQHLQVAGRLRPSDWYATDLLNPIFPTSVQLIDPPASQLISNRFTGNLSEIDGYLGVPALLLLGIAAWRLWDDLVVRVCAILALIVAILSMGPTLRVGGAVLTTRMPWGLAEFVPLLNSLLPARLMMFTDVLAAFLVAALIAHVWRQRRMLPWVGTAAGVVAIAVSFVPVQPYLSANVRSVSYLAGPGATEQQSRLVMVVAEGSYAMLWQAQSGFRYGLTDAYILTPPGQLRADLDVKSIELGEASPLTSELRQKVAAELRDYGVGAVIVGPVSHQQEILDYLKAVIGRPPRRAGQVYLWSPLWGS